MRAYLELGVAFVGDEPFAVLLGDTLLEGRSLFDEVSQRRVRRADPERMADECACEKGDSGLGERGVPVLPVASVEGVHPLRAAGHDSGTGAYGPQDSSDCTHTSCSGNGCRSELKTQATEKGGSSGTGPAFFFREV